MADELTAEELREAALETEFERIFLQDGFEELIFPCEVRCLSSRYAQGVLDANLMVVFEGLGYIATYFDLENRPDGAHLAELVGSLNPDNLEAVLIGGDKSEMQRNQAILMARGIPIVGLSCDEYAGGASVESDVEKAVVITAAPRQVILYGYQGHQQI